MKWCFQSTKMEEGGSPLLLVRCANNLVIGRRLKMATAAKTRSDSEATSDRRRLEKEEEEEGEKEEGGKGAGNGGLTVRRKMRFGQFRGEEFAQMAFT